MLFERDVLLETPEVPVLQFLPAEFVHDRSLLIESDFGVQESVQVHIAVVEVTIVIHVIRVHDGWTEISCPNVILTSCRPIHSQ